jgi:hypothetical protein
MRLNCTGLDNQNYLSKAGKKCDIFVIGWDSSLTDYMSKFLTTLKNPLYVNSKIICRQPSAKEYLIKNGINEKLVYLMDSNSKYWCNWSVKNCLTKVNINDDIKVTYSEHKDETFKNKSKYGTTGFVILLYAVVSGIKPKVYGYSLQSQNNKQIKTLSHILLDNNPSRAKSERYPSEHDIPSEHRILKRLIDSNLIEFIQ